MPRAGINPQISVERFFQLSVLGLVTSGYLAVAGSGYLDTPTIVLTGLGLFARALLVTGIVQLEFSSGLITLATLGYIAFYPVDYFFLSHTFLQATIHLVFFLAVVKILTARTNRDYLYRTVRHLRELGIADGPMHRIERRVRALANEPEIANARATAPAPPVK